MASFRIDSEHPSYPKALAVLSREGAAPPPIFVEGTLPGGPGIAIVGTRRPTEAALAFARTLSAELVAEGFVIWSGGARGIDAAAHEGALEAGGVTAMIAGGGLARAYPPEHVPLFRRIVDAGGALVARVPDDVPPQRPGFLLRNEVLAAVTVATVVIEAGVVSGARSTAAAARRFGRPLCVVPHAPWHPAGAGCAAELAAGAIAVTSTKDVLAAIHRGDVPPLQRPRRRKPPTALPLRFERSTTVVPVAPAPEALRILAALALENPLHIDQVAEISGLPYRTTAGVLLTLTLQAVVVEGPAGFYRRVDQ